MTRFDADGNCLVEFVIQSHSQNGSRSRISMRMEDWMALSKVANSLEELRVLAFDYGSPCRTARTKAAAAGKEAR